MRINQLAKRCGVKTDTIRYYEKRHLLPEPPRTEMFSAHPGYRIYGDEDVERVQFIINCKKLGFSLDEISQLLTLRRRKDGYCAHVIELAQDKMKTIENKIAQLEQIHNHLRAFVSECSGPEPTYACSFFDKIVAESLDKEKQK